MPCPCHSNDASCRYATTAPATPEEPRLEHSVLREKLDVLDDRVLRNAFQDYLVRRLIGRRRLDLKENPTDYIEVKLHRC